ncbi:MAG: phosphoribosylformylglycinamidine synthase subunit PurL, partial [Sphingomicrobium sp.]
LVALAEMALASDLGTEVGTLGKDDVPYWFGENQARYLVTVSDTDRFWELARDTKGLGVLTLGYIKAEPELIIETQTNRQVIPLADLRAAHEGFFPALMQGEL